MEKRIYRVVVRNSLNKIEAMRTFDSFDIALTCFVEFQRNKYSHFDKISIEAILI